MSTSIVLQPSSTSGARSRLAPVLHGLGEALEQAAIRRERGRRVAEAQRELHALDDRMLRDIGIPRAHRRGDRRHREARIRRW